MPSKKNNSVSIEGVRDINTRDALRQLHEKIKYIDKQLKRTNFVVSSVCQGFTPTAGTTWQTIPELQESLECAGERLVQLQLVPAGYTPTDFFQVPAPSIAPSSAQLHVRFVRNDDFAVPMTVLNSDASGPLTLPPVCFVGYDFQPPKGRNNYKVQTRYSTGVVTPSFTQLQLLVLEVK
jgi:hypothetical protein